MLNRSFQPQIYQHAPDMGSRYPRSRYANDSGNTAASGEQILADLRGFSLFTLSVPGSVESQNLHLEISHSVVINSFKAK